MNGAWPWLALAAAGAFHGLNPAMGWLFAVDAGMQERSRHAVARALPFIALGHALSIGMFAVAIGAAGIVVDPRTLQLACAGVLVAFGMWKLARVVGDDVAVKSAPAFQELVEQTFSWLMNQASRSTSILTAS